MAEGLCHFEIVAASSPPFARLTQFAPVNDLDRRWSTNAYAGREAGVEQIRVEPGALDRLYESGRAVAASMFADVAPLFRGRGVVIEIGCGAGHVLLGHAQTFERLRGVDPRPEMLAALEQRAAAVGVDTAQGFLPDQAWDEPTGSADYAYSVHVFQQMEDRLALANYLQGMSAVLRRGGIVQVAFDTRPRDLRYRASLRVPNRFLTPEWRRSLRSTRRKEDWVRDRFRGADLQLIGERQFGSAEHWFVARRR